MGNEDGAIRRAIYVSLFFSSLLSVVISSLSSMFSFNLEDQSENNARCARGEAALSIG